MMNATFLEMSDEWVNDKNYELSPFVPQLIPDKDKHVEVSFIKKKKRNHIQESDEQHSCPHREANKCISTNWD